MKLDPQRASALALDALSLSFILLAVAFVVHLWGHPRLATPVPLPDKVFTSTATLRMSVPELLANDEDTSGLDCYACHKEGKKLEIPKDAQGNVVLPSGHKDLIFARRNCAACHSEKDGVELEWDDDGNAIIPPAHQDLTLRHGRSGRNNHCFNCHDPSDLRYLRTRNGARLQPKDSNLLCAGCHGPKYRDWEIGIHGRTSGFWDLKSGAAQRKDCTACHDPHAPIFPAYLPGPPPHVLHPRTARGPQPHQEAKND